MQISNLESQIESFFALPAPEMSPERRQEALVVFAEFKSALDRGEIRAASRGADGDWVVNQWVKRGILLGFRLGAVVDYSIDDNFRFFDKDTYQTKRVTINDGVRIVPGGTTAREGAYLGQGVTIMPPAFVNVGAYVGDGTMIDSHALVGSCAQVGKRCHISAGAQIGGVLEPVGAIPVIVEDEVLVGGNCGVYEGAVIKTRAVLASGTILTGSTPLYDLPSSRIIVPEPGQPLVVPAGAVVVPGARAVTVGAGREWGLSLATPVIVKYRDDRTDTRTELEA